MLRYKSAFRCYFLCLGLLLLDSPDTGAGTVQWQHKDFRLLRVMVSECVFRVGSVGRYGANCCHHLQFRTLLKAMMSERRWGYLRTLTSSAQLAFWGHGIQHGTRVHLGVSQTHARTHTHTHHALSLCRLDTPSWHIHEALTHIHTSIYLSTPSFFWT